MTINEMKPLSLAEAKELIENVEENKELIGFIKKFTKISADKAEKLRKELENLEMIKLREEHISKIIDLLPEDNVDLNKIFVDISLDENEIAKLLETIKKYK